MPLSRFHPLCRCELRLSRHSLRPCARAAAGPQTALWQPRQRARGWTTQLTPSVGCGCSPLIHAFHSPNPCVCKLCMYVERLSRCCHTSTHCAVYSLISTPQAAADALARMAPHLPTESAARSLEAARAPHRLAPESDLSADSAVALRRCLAALEGAPAAAAALAAAEEEEAKSWAWVAHGDGAGSPSGSADDGRCGASSDDSTGAAGSAPPMPAVSGPAGGLLLNDSGDSSKAVSAANAEAAATPAVALGGVGGAVPTAAAAEAGDDDSATGNKRSSSGDEQEDKTELFSLD